jgi:hypothetical protein
MVLGACNIQIVCASSNLKTGLESSRINMYFVSHIFYERLALKRARCIENCTPPSFSVNVCL